MTQPVFVLSAGPRSGSTLLQRLITSSGDVLVWGESNGSLNHILESFRLLNFALQPGDKGGANGAQHFKRFCENKEDRSTQWVASMNPPAAHILKTYRSMFDNLYGIPARSMNYGRWGVKEVRGTKFTIDLLRLIFPEAKFVFLVRNPFDSLRSIKQRKFLFANNWGTPVTKNQLLYFASNWAQLSLAYYDQQNCFKVRYEDLKQKDFDVTKLCEYLGISHVDFKLVGGKLVDWKAPEPDLKLTEEEIQRVTPLLNDAMKLWGYL